VIAIAGRWSQRASRSSVILAVVIVLLAAATGWLFFNWQTDQAANAARTGAVTAAKKDVPALLSYSYSSFSTDLASAEAATTAQFRNTYGNLMTGQIESTAKQNQVVTQATVSSASVVTAQPTNATLLLFLSQQTKTKAKQESVLNDTAVRVVMRKVNGTWLVDSLVPRS
jgi:Mce-associated membrane protein